MPRGFRITGLRAEICKAPVLLERRIRTIRRTQQLYSRCQNPVEISGKILQSHPVFSRPLRVHYPQ